MILVDSNILIRFSRGDHEAANWLKINDELMVSVVTELELLVVSRQTPLERDQNISFQISCHRHNS